MNTSRPIVITPYYKEDPSLLRRCIDSVRKQTVATTHLLVADGHPQDWIDKEGVRHLRLDRSHGDFGNTPRGVAAILAASEGFAPIMMLDADNWLEPQHVEVCLRAAGPETDFVVARSVLRRPDESILPLPTEPHSEHVDTSCFAFFPGSYHALATWALMPQQMSPLGDRIFWSALRSRGLSGVAVENPATVNYHCLWDVFYRALGETPPPDAKPSIDPTPMYQWWRGLTPREREIATRRAGISLDSLPR
jgi:glycosyltransferase involved in cell wall biosynthesis